MSEEDTESEIYGEQHYGEESRSTTTISYHSEDFISKPTCSQDGTVPFNILEFHYSFGYDCRKRFNLCVADPNTLIFASGNLIHFFDVAENNFTFRRCSTGGGIGNITKNPTFNHIAIGENGINPPIIIYEWPSMDIVTILHGGTTRSFSCLRYSPDGLELVSQGGEPDYLITVWDWQRSKIALQCKSHGQDVFNVVFSATMPGHMTSCGSGHIKCWKMSKTFTGLKLQGELGRFGKTEISDIIGVYPMPDEKIISGCEWGNILVWDEGLIKIEVCRKNHRSCHANYISQFEYINEELISVGTDGYINVWYYETIDQAEPSEDNNFIEVEPIYEFRIGGQPDDNSMARPAMLMQILKQDTNDPDNTLWYAQDGNGGIWLVDICTLQTPKPSEKLLTCHAGSIMDMDVADWGPYAATIGEDGCLHIYNFEEKKLILAYQFRDSGTCVIWLPCSVEPSGWTLICAFNTGVVRMVSVDSSNLDKAMDKGNGLVKLTQVSKPHTMKITCSMINPTHSIFVTGSEDLTIFIFQIKIYESYPNLVPIGYIQLPSYATYMTWKPQHPTTLFVGCSEGDCVQIDLPEGPQPYTKISYKLTEGTPIIFKFESVKSAILREQARLQLEEQKMEKLAQKKEELRLLRENNPGIEIDEELFLEADMEEETPLPEIYIPEKPNSILTAFYTTRGTVLLSVAGYDAGYTYEFSNPEVKKKSVHVKSTLVVDSDDAEIRSYLFYSERRYVIFGMEHGEIRVCKVNPDDDADFSDYWILPMHDNFFGCIPVMRLSCDQKMLLTCGYDGNIFSYTINDNVSAPEVKIPNPTPTDQLPPTVPDIEDSDYPSLDQVITRAEENRIMANAKEEKDKTLAILRELTEEYNAILKRNNELPISQRLSDAELELDPRITADLQEQLKEKMDLVHRKLAYKVEKAQLRLKKLMDHFIEPITCLPFAVIRILRPDTMVHSLRELKLTGEYAPIQQFTQRKSQILNEEMLLRYGSESDVDDRSLYNVELDDDDREGSPKLQDFESFLKGLSPHTIAFELGDEINQMLKKYRALKAKLEEKELEWKILQAEKPDPKAINPEDEEAIEHAKNTIGDYKLKASLVLEDDVEKRPTVCSKSSEIISCRRRIHFRREDYNEKLRNLRARKVELETEVKDLIKRLKNIHVELPAELVKPLPPPPTFDYDVEFPERNLQREAYIPMSARVEEIKKKKQSVTLNLPVEDFDEEYEVLLLDESHFQPEKSLFNIENKTQRRLAGDVRQVRYTVAPEVLAALVEAEKSDTKIEREMKRVRAAKKSHEQEQILDYVHKCYEMFDEELDELEKERLNIVHESIYMDLYLLTLHQELIILKRFEGMENELSDKVGKMVQIKGVVNKEIEKCRGKIDDKNQFISKLQDRIKENQMRYLNSIREDKFYNFLKRVCKKKYKAPKPDDASSSESSSSESSSEEEPDDAASDNSQNIRVLHLDETVMPEGCDRELYEEAFAVREKRYEMEHRIRDEQRFIEGLQRKLDLQRTKMLNIEVELQTDREKLEAFLREKQRQLNDIDVTVILKLHQLQCFSDSEKAEKIQNCIVFDKNKLSQLYARVGELQQETADQLAKHKNDRVHLRKMKADCESMKKELESLKREIKKEMEQKFGQQVSLVALYEAVLRRLIYDIKANTSSIIKFYDEKIKCIKSEYKQQLQVMKDLIQDNTEKLGFLTVLEEELLKLRKILNVKLVSEEEINKLESQYECDLNKLKTMLKKQKQQKELIIKDIRNLSNKSKNLVPIDQLKSKGSRKRRRPTLTLFDGAEKEVLKYDFQDNYSKDDTSTSSQAKEFLLGDSDYYKKIIAIGHLLSQIATTDQTNAKATIEEMLQEITKTLLRAGYCQEEVEKTISEIMTISQEGYECSQTSSKDTIESLSDVIYRYSTELREASFAHKIKQVVREQLNDLFVSVGIQDDTGHIAQYLVIKLKTTDNVNPAVQYVLQKLPSNTDDETREALHKHIKQTLIDIMKHIEREDVEIEETGSMHT